MHFGTKIKFLCPTFFAAILPALASPPTAITPNGFGTTVLAPVGGVTNIQGGTPIGNNLFHSFSTFNLGTGATADFNVNSNVSNIVARVTGGASTIDGTITSSLTGGGPSSANLFFINPAGVLFNANAQVNLRGSFTVSTADYAKLSDGAIFYADVNHPVSDAGLTTAAVSAFGFINATPQPISFAGAQLTNAGGIHVNGGDLTFDAGSPDGVTLQTSSLAAPSGNLTLFSAASAGEVPFSLAAPGAGFAAATHTHFGNIALRNGTNVNIDGAGGGKVVIRGGHLTVDKSLIGAANYGPFPGGTITVLSDFVAVSGAGKILTSAFSSGDAGAVDVHAGLLTLDGTPTDFSLIGSSTGSPVANQPLFNTGNTGAVTVDVATLLQLNAHGQIASSTFSNGNAGAVQVHAGALVLDGSAIPDGKTGITSTTGTPDGTAFLLQNHLPLTTGQSGPVTVNADAQLAVGGGATIATASFSGGRAGDVAVNSGGLVSVLAAGQIASLSEAVGDAGNVSVQTLALSIDGTLTPSQITGISSLSDTTSFGKGGDVNVTAAQVSILGAGTISTLTRSPRDAGNVSVQTQDLSIDGTLAPTKITGIGSISDTTSFGKSGNVDVTAAQVTILGAGTISTLTRSPGDAGNITVQTQALSIDGTLAPGHITGIGSLSDTTATGKGGDVNVTATQTLSLLGAGKIQSVTLSSRDSGNVIVHAGSLSMDGITNTTDYTLIGSLTGAPTPTEFFSNTGNAGSVQVTVDRDLVIGADGLISSSTFSNGNSGAVAVHAGSIMIDGTALPDGLTGIASVSGTSANTALRYVQSRPFTVGNAGAVQVTADHALVLKGGGSINNSTFTTGNAGDTTVQTESLTIDGMATPNHFTAISSDTGQSPSLTGGFTLPSPETGNAGKVSVHVDQALTIGGYGEIATDSFSFGNAGEVSVHAGSISIDGSGVAPGVFTGISSGSVSLVPFSPGIGGLVTVTSDSSLTLLNRGGLSVTTSTSGKGGSLSVNAATLTIAGSGSPGTNSTTPGSATGITAQAQATGDSGDITVHAGNVTLTGGGTVAASSDLSDAGNIVINAANVTLESASNIDTSAGANGGGITLNVGTLVYLHNSQIRATAGLNGGNIVIDPQFIVLDHGLISANAAQGQGGNITIITNNFLNNGTLITASGTTNGTIDISSPDLDLSGSLIALPNTLVSNANRLREKCARSVNREFSSFIVVGRGGTESGPEELQPDFGFDNVLADER